MFILRLLVEMGQLAAALVSLRRGLPLGAEPPSARRSHASSLHPRGFSLFQVDSFKEAAARSAEKGPGASALEEEEEERRRMACLAAATPASCSAGSFEFACFSALWILSIEIPLIESVLVAPVDIFFLRHRALHESRPRLRGKVKLKLVLFHSNTYCLTFSQLFFSNNFCAFLSCI